jgi:hypothetical protein
MAVDINIVAQIKLSGKSKVSTSAVVDYYSKNHHTHYPTHNRK